MFVCNLLNYLLFSLNSNELELKLTSMDNYKGKKLRMQDVIKYIVRHITDKSSERILKCGDLIYMLIDKLFENKKLHTANFCGNRFCPMCAWRLAKKTALKISILMDHISSELQKEYIMLTLTAPNVTGEDLEKQIKKFNLAFKNLIKRKEVEGIVKGYIRKLEITYDKDKFITKDMWFGNAKKHINPRGKYYKKLSLKIGDKNPNYNTYHPHFHVLIVVNKSYFTQTTQYLKQETWLKLWRDLMNDQTITQVDVRKIKINDGKQVNEMAKYASKDEDYSVSQEVFDTFYNSLKGKQVITYNGLFAEANKLYKAKKLDHLKIKDNTEYVYMLLYQWGKGEYVEAERRELTESERLIINKQLIEEIEIEEE